MDSKSGKQMAKMVDAVQPHCDEPIVAAMTCSHEGSMSSTLISKFLGGAGAGGKSCQLPNPVFIAVGANTIYAFDYRPRGFRFKIKKEVARWPRNEITVAAQETGMMCHFTMTTSAGESFALEVPTVMGGQELVQLFLAAMGAS
ncbi:MAG: hypothetical protein ABII93_02815 [Chrysiogenia bacterium]